MKRQKKGTTVFELFTAEELETLIIRYLNKSGIGRDTVIEVTPKIG
jgi:hypothetical protein